MIRIALSSIITLAAAYATHSASEYLAYINILLLIGVGFAAGSLIMFAVLNDSEVK